MRSCFDVGRKKVMGGAIQQRVTFDARGRCARHVPFKHLRRRPGPGGSQDFQNNSFFAFPDEIAPAADLPCCKCDVQETIQIASSAAQVADNFGLRSAFNRPLGFSVSAPP
jgi:hypothetical protein